MSTIVIKNLPDHLHVQLKERAAHNHRSMNKEVVHLIAAGLSSGMFDVGAMPDTADAQAPKPAVPRSPPAPAPAPATTPDPAPDGRAALRAALIKQADGSFLNVLGIEDEAFFDTLELIRVEPGATDADDSALDEGL